MKKFNVYQHPVKGIEAVKAGFSWPAFFFGFFWMVVKKLWLYAAVWFAFYIVLSAFEPVAVPEQGDPSLIGALLLLIAYIAAWVIPGFKGNTWRESYLVHRGYARIASVEATSPDAAIANVMRAPLRDGTSVI